MEAEVKTIHQLFSPTIQYVIPQFQRFYDWEKDKQWEPLWDDVRNVSEAVLAQSDQEDKRVPPHFMGSLVLKDEPMPNHNVPEALGRRSIIVDGQQRLTTIQVLARAIVGVADRLGHPDAVEPLRALIANPELQDEWRYKVLQSHQRDADTYQRLMQDPHGDRSVRDAPLLNHRAGIEAAHNYFSTVVSDYIDDTEATDETRQSRVDALQQTIAQHLQFAILTLDEDEQPNMVFETINARGQTLAEHQLVKSTVMYEAGVVLDARLSKRYWNAFEDDEWWGIQNQDRGHISRFLSDWLTSVRLRNIQTARISAEFRALVRQGRAENQDLSETFDLMNRAGVTYHNVINRVHADYGPFHAAMTDIGAQSVMSACLWMDEPTNGLGDPEQDERIIRLMESYAFRRALVGKTTNFVPIIQIIHNAIQDKKDPWLALRDSFMHHSSARPEYWPDDQFIKDHLTYNPCKTGKTTQTILRTMENYLREQEPTTPVPPDTPLTEHHLMPTTPTQWEPGSHWAIRGNRAAGTAKRTTAVRTIGNLTLIALKRASLKNQDSIPWQQKQELLQNGNVLHINRSLLGVPTWDENAINERSAYIADLATQIWPR